MLEIAYFRMQNGDWIITEVASQDTDEGTMVVENPYRIMYMWDTNISAMVRKLLPFDYGNPKGKVMIFTDAIDAVPEYLPDDLLAEYQVVLASNDYQQSAH